MDFSKLRSDSGSSGEIAVEVGSGVVGEVGGSVSIVNPFLVDDGDDEIVGGVSSGGVSSHVGEVLEVVDGGSVGEGTVSVGSGVERVSPVSVARGGSVGGGRKGGSVEWRREVREGRRVRRFGGSGEYRERKGGLEGEVGSRGAREVLVDEFGVPVGRVSSGEQFDALVRAAEVGGSVRVPEGGLVDGSVVGDVRVAGKVVFPWVRVESENPVSGGKRARVRAAELEFFKSVGGGKRPVLGVALGERVRGGVGERSKRVAGKSVGGVSLKDFDVLVFLAKFKYASARAVANLHGVGERTSRQRLLRLRSVGLVDSVRLWGSEPVWVVTRAGMLLSGFDLPLVSASRISYALLAHQFVVNNVASNLFGGGVNVLSLDGWPERLRVDGSGQLRFGEEVVSETELQSSFSKMKLLQKSEVYRPLLVGSIEKSFGEWEAAGCPAVSPEMLFGNEFMWLLFPPFNLNTVYHMPDLVVKRERGPGGEPRSIAVEVELNPKGGVNYERVLQMYKADRRLYSKVVWVCKGVQVARSLEKVAKEIGLWQEGRIDIVPIVTREGVFEGRDLWTI